MILGGGVFVIIKGSTVDVAGEETKGFGGLLVRHTPMVFVIARVSSFPKQTLAQCYLFKLLAEPMELSG